MHLHYSALAFDLEDNTEEGAFLPGALQHVSTARESTNDELKSTEACHPFSLTFLQEFPSKGKFTFPTINGREHTFCSLALSFHHVPLSPFRGGVTDTGYLRQPANFSPTLLAVQCHWQQCGRECAWVREKSAQLLYTSQPWRGRR
ncbi:uncharacterized protein Tco025E_01827 [Trypanosoma conorhini]|uniref:Uncharacterized protein n=1 Tax=Trypanosoma conorhini TaxID=83891 RepID=A0A3R7NYR3_9TRYP|nr:uncharacterized protein Tco025E_01827 [Trypanosoma conorhini]RNF25959.1 hypothetical protein Tco025E_01827 [Trypanosoma conorhini]